MRHAVQLEVAGLHENMVELQEMRIELLGELTSRRR